LQKTWRAEMQSTADGGTEFLHPLIVLCFTPIDRRAAIKGRNSSGPETTQTA
jgi:hypothetical protein